MNRQVVLVGHPNAGKSSLLNALTGSQARVGNWPGVTVCRTSGKLKCETLDIEIIDLPGTYSLARGTEDAIDENIVCDFLKETPPHLVLNVIDATQLERSLYLTSQLLDLNLPMLVVLTKLDVATKSGLKIYAGLLEKKLNCPVIGVDTHKKKNIPFLKNKIIEELVRDDNVAIKRLPESFQNDSDVDVAKRRYDFAYDIVNSCAKTFKLKTAHTPTDVIDRVVLNRVLGIPIFLFVMYAMFFFAINLGGIFKDFIDILSSAIFVKGIAYLLQLMHAPNVLIAILAAGLGKGISTVLTFVPVLGAMFIFFGFLEESGYMTRAAFVVDRLMRMLGLSGRAFVPMIIGFGCNVPAIMACRTLHNKRDRILTIVMSPFISCGARLAVFTAFVGVFFPRGGQNIVFLLYLLGIVMAVLTGLMLRKTILTGKPAPLVMDMPNYHMPSLKSIWRQTRSRLKMFVKRAGKIIVPLCMLLGVLNGFTIDGGLSIADAHHHSLLSHLGRMITGLFAPMGINSDNWPATVGLLTGTLAKEVVIGTLNTLYSQMGHLNTTLSDFSLWAGMKEAFISVAYSVKALPAMLAHPITMSVPMQPINQGVNQIMANRFQGQTSVFAYLIFILLYMPCVSTVAVMSRELNRGWAIFSMLWSVSLAYGVAVMFYQLATFHQHPITSIIWVIVVALSFVAVIAGLKLQTKRLPRSPLDEIGVVVEVSAQ